MRAAVTVPPPNRIPEAVVLQFPRFLCFFGQIHFIGKRCRRFSGRSSPGLRGGDADAGGCLLPSVGMPPSSDEESELNERTT